MKSSLRIEEISTGLAAHEAAKIATQRESARIMAEKAKQESERAAKVRKEQLQHRLEIVEAEQTATFRRCLAIEEEIKAKPGQLLLERSKQSVLLREIAQLRRELGVNL